MACSDVQEGRGRNLIIDAYLPFLPQTFSFSPWKYLSGVSIQNQEEIILNLLCVSKYLEIEEMNPSWQETKAQVGPPRLKEDLNIQINCLLYQRSVSKSSDLEILQKVPVLQENRSNPNETFLSVAKCRNYTWAFKNDTFQKTHKNHGVTKVGRDL